MVILWPQQPAYPAPAGYARGGQDGYARSPWQPPVARRERPASAGSFRSAPGRVNERPSSARRQRPASAGSFRQPSSGYAGDRPSSAGRERPQVASSVPVSAAKQAKPGIWDRAPRLGKSTESGHCLDETNNLAKIEHERRSEQVVRPRALLVAPRRRAENQRWQWEMWNGTLLRDEMSCSVPAPLARAMRLQWREASKMGSRFLCIFETCQNCHEHSMTTKHDPKAYFGYKNTARDWIKAEFPFISFADLRCVELDPQTRRIGSFEIYLLCPSDRGSVSSSSHVLLHSKLMTRRWPVREALIARVRVGLPDVVARVQDLGKREVSRPEVEATVREAEEWGLGSWEPVAELGSRMHKMSRVLHQGEQACATGNKEELRDAVRQGQDLQLSDDTVAGWRDNLKAKNLVVFNMKHHASRFRRNAEYKIAVRLVQSATERPLKLDLLKRAVEKARSAEMPEEDIESILDLLPKVSEIVAALEVALQDGDLDGIVQALESADDLSLHDTNIEVCLDKVSHLASKVVMAAELNDLVELNSCLGSWSVPDEAYEDKWSESDFAAILKAEASRQKLQALVDEAEKRFTAGRWDALQKSVDRLSNVHVDEEKWNRWAAALKREHNFVIMKAVSGAGVELKRKLYSNRLQAALHAPSIPLQQLQDAIDNAEEHRVEESLLAKARGEVSTVRQRTKAAADAAAKRRVDTAEVLLWKLQSGRIRVEEVEKRSGPLWAMVDALKAGEAAQDWEAMQKAMEGWAEDKPGTQHEAFTRDDSPTCAFRLAHSRIRELRLIDLRNELGACVDSLSKPTASHEPRDVPQELQHVVRLGRELLELGWEMTAPRRARLLALPAMLGAGNSDTASPRFGATALRTITQSDSARIVFLLDQTRSMKSDAFNNYLKPAVVLVANEIQRREKGAVMGAVAYGPVKKVQDLSPDLSAFKETVSKHVFADGREAPVAKALRKALELFKHERGQAPESERDSVRLVFHFTSREPDKPKDATKAFNLLEAQGVTVVGIAVGPLLSEDSLQECSSPGLVFKVADASALQKFVEDAFASMEDLLTKAEKLTPEEALHRLEEIR